MAGAIVDLKDAIAARDCSSAMRDDALIFQLSDVHKYVSDVHAAQLPVQSMPIAEDLHTLGENVAFFIDSAESRFNSFQAVLNVIMEHVTASTAPEPVHAPPIPMYFPAAPPKHSVPPVPTAAIMAAPVPVVSGVPLAEHVNWSGQHVPADMHAFPPFSQVNPASQSGTAYSAAPFSQYPSASRLIRGHQDNCFVHVWNINPGPWNAHVFSCVLIEEACSIIFHDSPSGLNFRDVPEIRCVNPTSLIITFKFPKDVCFLPPWPFQTLPMFKGRVHRQPSPS